jgi:HYR domain
LSQKGYKALGKRVAVCNQSKLEWHPSDTLECIPARIPVVKVQKDSLNYHHHERAAMKPAIKCPNDISIIKPQSSDKILVQLDRAEFVTNVDWNEFVDSIPETAKNLKMTLEAGKHEITFRARSHFNTHFDACRFIIHVHEPSVPTVTFCPSSFTVILNQFETSRSLFWKEAKFESKYPLAHISKSAKSGTSYGIGVHNIVYLASTADGSTAKCSFKITVKSKKTIDMYLSYF